MKLHIAAPVAGKRLCDGESSDGRAVVAGVDVPARGWSSIPVDKTHGIATISIAIRWWLRPAVNLVPRRQNAPWGYHTYRWGMKTAASI